MSNFFEGIMQIFKIDKFFKIKCVMLANYTRFCGVMLKQVWFFCLKNFAFVL